MHTSSFSLVLRAFFGSKPLSHQGLYVKGFLDAYLGRIYDDGIHPPHGFEVCVPLDDDSYRTGWLDGKALRIR